MVARWQSTMRAATCAAEPRGLVASRPRSRGGSRPAAPCAPGRRRRSRRPARRGPSSSSRTCPAMAPRPRPGSSSRGAGSPPPRPPPARRCRRCSSAPRRRGRGGAARARRCRPGSALRRWPMWAALFGIDARVLDDDVARPRRRRPALDAGAPSSSRANGRRGRGRGSRSRRPRPRRARTPGAEASSGASRSAISRGLRRKVLARSKGAVRARSPSSTRGGYWKETRPGVDVEGGAGARRAALGEAPLEIQDHSKSSYRRARAARRR